MDSYKSKFTEASFGDSIRNIEACIDSSYDLIEQLQVDPTLSGDQGRDLRGKVVELRR